MEESSQLNDSIPLIVLCDPSDSFSPSFPNLSMSELEPLNQSRTSLSTDDDLSPTDKLSLHKEINTSVADLTSIGSYSGSLSNAWCGDDSLEDKDGFSNNFSGMLSDIKETTRRRSISVAEVKEMAYSKLQNELVKAQEELKLKDEECLRLSKVRDKLGEEIEDLSVSLFEEAHRMVREANVRRAAAEKGLKEANLKIEVLQAEVQALKALVLTSTPSTPNKHLHPHIDPKNHRKEDEGFKFIRGHKRSPSHNDLKSSAVKRLDSSSPTPPDEDVRTELPENKEIDPIYHREFVSWREKPELNKNHQFLIRLYDEDILPCLNFSNKELARAVQECVENNTLIVEQVAGQNSFPKSPCRKCALSEAPRICNYRMKLGDSEQWHNISQFCRNRIIAVCDFFTYLRYIQQGLVKCGVHDAYWEIIRLRKSMSLARLGLCS